MSRIFHMPGLPIGQETNELARMEALVADLRAYCRGAGPTELDLRRAPEIAQWRTIPDPCSIRLIGRVDGHPSVGPGPGITSQVIAVDPNRRWIRSHSRLWRLGEPAPDQHDLL